ncbi:MAG TPA: type II secretion system secretin GspD [Desulfuromonadaceae bacterium]
MTYLIRTFCSLLLAGTLLVSPVAAASKGVVLNFNEVDISTMVKFISDLTGKNFVLDDRVKGKISVFSPSKLSIDEAYNVFVSVLELKGFTVVQSGKVAKIVPTAGIKQSGFTLLSEGAQAPVNEKYVAQVYKLDNITAQEAMTFLQPMVSKDGHISAFGPGNLLLILDSSINLRKLRGILEMIDTDRPRANLEVIYLKNAAAEGTATAIRQWLTGSDRPPAPGQQAATGGGAGAGVMADQRLNALLIYGNDNAKAAIREMVAKLDVAPPEASSKVNVYYLENTDATEMAKVLDGVVKGISNLPAGQPGQAVAAAAPQASPFESGKITITPDKASNSLVIMASLADYNNIIQVIKKLDRRSKQVFVQVLIAEVSLNKSRDIGMQAGLIGAGAARYIAGGGFYDPFGALAGLIKSDSAIGAILQKNPDFSFQKPVNIAAVLSALDSNGLLNVLSTPNILTSDNKEAEITVGDNVPFKGASTLVSSGISTTSVERKDVGINLKIKPQISEGDYIRMDINQEISAVKPTDATLGAQDLITSKRAAKTSIVIKDNETVVIGGLIQDQETENISKVPFLGDIPGLGWLFKTKSKSRQKTNLMILLTPHIVKDATDLSSISNQQRQQFGEAAKNVESVDVQKEISGQKPLPGQMEINGK